MKNILTFFFYISLLFRVVVGLEEVLFAVLGGRRCAEDIQYGPLTISTSGASSGGTQYPYYLSTRSPGYDFPHTEWTQVVTSDGTNELFRIYWTFQIAKTLSNRIVDATGSGESVDYRVVDASTGTEYDYQGVWYFSKFAYVDYGMFQTSTTATGFSYSSGAWGAGSGDVDGAFGSYVTSNFWGIGNWGGSDYYECSTVYRAGVPDSSYGSMLKTYMYYNVSTEVVPSPTAVPTVEPTVEPTEKPTVEATFVVSAEPTQQPTALVTTQPTAVPTAQPPLNFRFDVKQVLATNP